MLFKGTLFEPLSLDEILHCASQIHRLFVLIGKHFSNKRLHSLWALLISSIYVLLEIVPQIARIIILLFLQL